MRKRLRRIFECDKLTPTRTQLFQAQGTQIMGVQLACHNPNSFGLDTEDRVSNTTQDTSIFKDCGDSNQS